LLAYLRGNRALLDSFIAERMPALKVVPGEATYLAWIDARGLSVENPAQHFEKKAGLFLSDGAFFGWPGWIRFNFGTTRAHMLAGLEKMAAVV
jgi:cystathionine beta-lyase